MRRLIQDPDRLLSGLVSEGQAVLDIGCGLGYSPSRWRAAWTRAARSLRAAEGGEAISVDRVEIATPGKERRARDDSSIKKEKPCQPLGRWQSS